MAEDLNFYLGGAEAIIGREAAVTLARREFCSSVWFIHSCFHLCSEVIKVLSICLIPSFFFFLTFYLTVLGLHGCGLSLVVASRDYSSLRCVSFSLRWLLLLQSMGSRGLAQ